MLLVLVGARHAVAGIARKKYELETGFAYTKYGSKL